MYTNGYTGQKFLSIIAVTNGARPVGYRCFTEAEFAAESEHVTLETAPSEDEAYRARPDYLSRVPEGC